LAAGVASYVRIHDEEVRNGRGAVQTVREWRQPDGTTKHWLAVKFPFVDAAGANGLAGFAVDVSARVDAEEKARRYAEDVRSLVNRLVQAQEAERRRVANELHDLIGQNLTALGIDLQALKQQLQSRGETIAGPRLDAMAGLVETTINAIRGVMTELRPAALEEFGLVPALRWYASVFSERTGIKVATQVAGPAARLSSDVELALFRIVQETLTNVAKHSGAANVKVAISYGDGVHLSVEDNGRGFADAAGARNAKFGGFGLTTMRERAQAHGGRLRVEFPARGTRVVVEIPKEADAH
jgi:signal transduction histidine kinase